MARKYVVFELVIKQKELKKIYLYKGGNDG